MRRARLAVLLALAACGVKAPPRPPEPGREPAPPGQTRAPATPEAPAPPDAPADETQENRSR